LRTKTFILALAGALLSTAALLPAPPMLASQTDPRN
jgi:hypothetical protein